MPRINLIVLLTVLLCSASRAEVNIVTTIKPLQMIAEAIVLEAGSVASIVDPQQSPHHFTVSPSDRIALARADIALWIGPQFETHISDFFAQRQVRAKTITAIDIPDLQLHTLGDGQIDAHLWLDSSNARRIAAAIAVRATELDPDNAMLYRQNLEKFTLELANRSSEIAERFKSPPTTSYAVYHNAYQYFERQFGLQHGVVLLRDPEVQPGIRQIVQLREAVKAQQPACLLQEFDSNKDLINTILNGHELNRITVDLLGSKVTAGEYAYSEFIASIADDFYRCLYQ